MKGGAGFRTNVETAMQFVSSKCKDGRFGSTQSTILSLKAIIEYDMMKAHESDPGELGMVVNGDVAAKIRTDDTAGQSTLTMPPPQPCVSLTSPLLR